MNTLQSFNNMYKLDIIPDCKLIHGDGHIIQQWDVSDPCSYHTGIDMHAYNIYSISSGVVIECDMDSDNIYVVTVQYDIDTVLRYMHMDSVQVEFGQILKDQTCIGKADNYVHFEYATRTPSDWPVRISDLNFYKHDPYPVLAGYILLPDSGYTDYDPYAVAHQTIF